MRAFKPQLTILSALCLDLALPQIASAQSTLLSGLYACEGLSGEAAQLSCFKAETAKLRAGEGSGAVLTAPRDPAAAPQAAVQNSAEPEFAPLAKDKPKGAKSQTVAIRSTSTNGNGYVRFTLENGEVWQQIEKARVRLGKGDSDALTIKRKSLGSFMGTVNDKRPSFRVRRVK